MRAALDAPTEPGRNEGAERARAILDPVRMECEIVQAVHDAAGAKCR